MKFDSLGRPWNERGVKQESNPNAILFLDLRLHAEHLVILGEAVQARSGVSRPSFVRNPPKIQTGFLYNHPVILDVLM